MMRAVRTVTVEGAPELDRGIVTTAPIDPFLSNHKERKSRTVVTI